MALPTLNATFASAADVPRRYMLAQWLVNISYSGSVADYVTLPEQYLWAKIAVAAGASRGEADYISLPKQYIWKAIYDAVSGSSLGTIDWTEKQALGRIAAAYRGDTANPANLATYIDWPWRYQVASVIINTAIDADAQAFITTSGATDVEGIDQFVKGVKNLGLYNSMVCWPLRSTQNAGTGTTAYSLGGLGTYNGTLVNGPVWTTNGITFGGNTQYIQYSPQFSIDFTEGGYSVHAVWSGMGVAVSSGEGAFGLFSSSDSVLENAITSGVLGGASWIPQSRNYNGNRYHGGTVSSLSISGDLGYGWNADTLTLQTNGSNITTSLNASFTPSNGLKTMRTAGRNNTTASATSRVSYLIAFPPNVGMTTGLMTSIYNTAKATLGQGLSLP
jgi:hypothetical protein